MSKLLSVRIFSLTREIDPTLSMQETVNSMVIKKIEQNMQMNDIP